MPSARVFRHWQIEKIQGADRKTPLCGPRLLGAVFPRCISRKSRFELLPDCAVLIARLRRLCFLDRCHFLSPAILIRALMAHRNRAFPADSRRQKLLLRRRLSWPATCGDSSGGVFGSRQRLADHSPTSRQYCAARSACAFCAAPRCWPASTHARDSPTMAKSSAWRDDVIEC